MSRKIVSNLAAMAAACLLSTAATAADFSIADPDYSPPYHGQSAYVGYLELYVGYMYQDFGEDDEDEEAQLGGAVRVARAFSPGFSGQFDLWTESSYDLGEESWDNFVGVGGHLTRRFGNSLFGVLGSLGYVTDQDGLFANLGLEAGASAGNLSVLGQVGYTPALTGEDADEDGYFLYAHGALFYYCNPNLVFGGDAGIYGYDEEDSSAVGFRWGAMVEGKRDGSPVSFFARYQGGLINWDDDDNYVEHIVHAGLKWDFGATTLRERNEAAGLADYNPLYGVNAARHR